MNKLKKSLIGYFIIFAFVTAIAESNMDSIFEPYINTINNASAGRIAVFFYLFISIAVPVIFSILFAVIVNRKVAAETQRQLNDRSSLYASITHDLKTPITTVMGFSQALKEGRVKESDMPSVLDAIYLKTKRVDELMDLLFAYTKLSTNEYQMHLEPTDLCRLVRECAAQNYEMFEDKKMTVEIDIPEHRIMRKADYMELSRAVNNLMINACRHNAAGSRVLIRITDDKKAGIIIADNGNAIAKEIEDRLFEPFVCSDESRNSNGGSGLGLAIARQVVEKHRGHIYIEHDISGYSKGFVIEM